MSDEVAPNVSVATLERRQVFDGGADLEPNSSAGVLSYVNEVSNDGDRYATPILLESTETITSVEWTGIYERELLNTNAADRRDRFVVEIFEGAADDAPDSSTAVRFEVAEPNRTEIGRGQARNRGGDVLYDYPVYGYSADVEYTMLAGKEYWISIYMVVENASESNYWWWRADSSDYSFEESVHRMTWTPDSATSGDNDWRYGGVGEKKANYFPGPNLDIRLRT